MKKFTLPIALAILAIIGVIACNTKKIVLVTNVELEYNQEYGTNGFVNEPIPATFTITPEAFLEEFVYYFKYEVEEGQGVFVNAEDEELPEGELIVLERTTDTDANFI